jgi:N-acetylneuraminic acid mutarotase
MPTARNDLTVAAVNGIVYAIGGKTGNTCVGLRTVEAYDPSTDTWMTKASLPTGRFNPRAVGWGGKIYVVGGDVGCGSRSNELDVYDPTTNTWTTKTPMPTTRTAPAAAMVDGTLYVIGGVAGNDRVATNEAYDVSADTWTIKAPIPVFNDNMVAGVINGVIYVVGGEIPPYNRPTYAYDPATDSWAAKASIPTPRVSPAAAVANGFLYAIGGYDPSTWAALHVVEAYDAANDEWTTEAPTPTGRIRFGAAAANGVLYAIGGGNDNAVVGTNEAFTPTLPACIAPPSNMVGWWPGDGNASDLIAGNNGTILGATSFATGEVGQGFALSAATGDGVTIPGKPAYNVNAPGFTADFWMKGDQNQMGGATLLEKSHGWVDGTGWAFQVGFTSGSGGPIGFWIGDGTAAWPGVGSSVGVLDGNFHHIAGTWDGSTIQLYVDGELQGATPLLWPVNNDRAVNIGFTWGGGNPQRFFTGTVDEVEIFTRALSATEIRAIHDAATAGKCRPANRPPVANAGPDQKVEATASSGAGVVLDGSASSDPDGDSLSYEWKDADGNVVGTDAILNLTVPLGTYTYTLTANDGKGGSATSSVTVTVQDTTPPSVSGTPDRSADSNGWYNHTLSVTWSGTDAASGIASCSGASTYSGPDSSSASVSGSCTDKAGNIGNGSFSFKFDSTLPVITITVPLANYNLLQREQVAASYSCTDTLSGVSSVSGPVSNGANVDTSTLGDHNFMVTCTDNAGNTATLPRTYKVITLAGGIGQAVDIVNGMNLQQGIENSLDAKLSNAQQALAASNAGQRQDAVNKLNAVISATEAQSGKQLSSEQADQIITQVRRIMALL